MKKLMFCLITICLFFNSNAQVADTTCEMVRGKCYYKFDYQNSERIEEHDVCSSRYKDTIYFIDVNEVLCLHLYDEGDKSQISFRRRITIYYRDLNVVEKRVKSKSNYFYFPGKEVSAIKVDRPRLF